MMRFAFVQCVKNSPVYVMMIEFVKTAIYDSSSMMSAQEPMSSAFWGQGRLETTETEHRGQNQKRNHPRHREMATSPSKEVNTPQHDGTPRYARR